MGEIKKMGKKIFKFLKWLAIPLIFVVGIFFSRTIRSDAKEKFNEDEEKGKDALNKIKETEYKVEADYRVEKAKLNKDITRVKEERSDQIETGKQIEQSGKEKITNINSASNMNNLDDEYKSSF